VDRRFSLARVVDVCCRRAFTLPRVFGSKMLPHETGRRRDQHDYLATNFAEPRRSSKAP